MACEMQRPAAPTPPPPKQELRRAPWFAHDSFGQLLINRDYTNHREKSAEATSMDLPPPLRCW
jgi:hypothetical protein